MFYQELTLMPDYGMNINHIWSRIFTQFHLAVASQMTNEKDSHIGVSFPNYFFEDKNVGLGNKLRIFAVDKEILENLNIAQWLSHCKDYVHIKQIREVPSDVLQHLLHTNVGEHLKALIFTFAVILNDIQNVL